ncbi:hypothetical protein K439DRAFT_1620946 [Ramaria rubella]|nr:hypothetical protein K439DRAFT_1620946 [Ramaria rubella]
MSVDYPWVFRRSIHGKPVGIPFVDPDICFPWILPGYGFGLWDTWNPHPNPVEDRGSLIPLLILLLSARAVSLKRPPHVFGAGDELCNVKISPLSGPLQSGVVVIIMPVIHHHYQPFAIGRESINGEFSEYVQEP